MADRYRALLDVGRKLAGTLNTKGLYAAIHQETARVIDASRFFISLHDRERDTARVVYFASDGVLQESLAPYGVSEAEAVGEGASMIGNVDAAAHAALMLGEDDGARILSSMSVPLVNKGVAVGSMTVQSLQADRYAEDDLGVFRVIADITSVAIENALHVAELERRRHEAERMEEIGRALVSSLDPSEVLKEVVGAVNDLLSVDGAAVWLNSEPGGADFRVAEATGVVTLPVGAEWDATQAISEGLLDMKGPMLVDDLAASDLVPAHLRELLEAGSGLMAPLVLDGELAGLLSAGSRTPRFFTREDVAVLQRLANQASVALGNARLHAHLQALSLMDPLTRLPNRRRLQIHLEKEIPAARRGRDLVVAVFDLDNFKRVNDTLGHVTGDEILRAFALVLEGENRAMNLVARYGGDEFLSVLSDTDMEGAEAYVKRVAERLDTHPVLSPHGVTASVGIAAFDEASMDRAEDLIGAADADMYRNKAEHGGRGTTAPEANLPGSS